jgi:hypothetical protein
VAAGLAVPGTDAGAAQKSARRTMGNWRSSGHQKIFLFFLMEAGGNHFKKNLVFLEVESQWNPTCSTCSPEQTSRDGSGMGQRWDCKTDGLLDDSAEKKAKFMVRSHISIHKWD